MLIVDYFLINHLVNKEVNELLIHQGERITANLERNGELKPDGYVLEVLRDASASAPNPLFRDTLIYDPVSEKMLPYRIYEFGAMQAGRPLRIHLRHILLETRELVGWLFLATTAVLLMLVFGIYLINQKIYGWALKPFFANLQSIKSYDVVSNQQVELVPTRINEFDELNAAVDRLIKQVEQDYRNLKEFNENIAHEMQTPLSVIRNRAVGLLESEGLGEKQRRQVDTIYREANRLSRIEKSLSLISRIENQEFPGSERIDLKNLTESIMSELEEMIAFRKIRWTCSLNQEWVEGAPELIRILITNLVRNAVQHNLEGGYIRITLESGKFVISNSGKVQEIGGDRLFERFVRGSEDQGGLGLGLAISRKICEFYGFELTYQNQQNLHTFVWDFRKASA